MQNLVLRFRVQHRLKLFEYRMLRVPKWGDVTREWGKLHSEELHVLYSSQKVSRINKSRKTGWTGHA